MKSGTDPCLFLKELSRFRPDINATSRALAVYSAAIAIADDDVIRKSSQIALELGADTASIYEMMLQSYLFLGFPRMLTAAECFQESFPEFVSKVKSDQLPSRFEDWRNRGLNLCQKVYGSNFEKLKNRLCLFSPEIFDWTILEGYGKVLSRPGLDIKVRELGIVASLMVDNRPKQLYSHIRGALNVNVPVETLEAVIKDVSSIAGVESKTAFSYLRRLRADD